jgi:hypothetical protein
MDADLSELGFLVQNVERVLGDVICGILRSSAAEKPPWAVEYVLSHPPRRAAGAMSDRLADTTGPKIAVALP